MILTRTAALIASIASVTALACQDSAPGGEDCPWGITCPGGTSCHEPTQQCVTAEQLDVCLGQADGTPCTYAGSGDYDTCEGGACVAASILETGKIGPIAVNDTHVFWVRYDPLVPDYYSILRMEHDGGPSEEVLGEETASSTAIVHDLKVNQTEVYWRGGSGGGFYRMPVEGGTPTVVAGMSVDAWCGAPFSMSTSFALGSSQVFGLQHCGDPATSFHTTLVRSGLHGEDATSIAFGNWYAGPGSPLAMETDDSHVYWIAPSYLVQRYGLFIATVDGTLLFQHQSNIAADDFALSPHGVFHLVDDEIRLLSPDFTNTDTLATGQDTAAHLDADDTHVYWTRRGGETSADGSVMTLGAAGGGAPQTFAENLHSPDRIAVAPQHVYWVNLGDPDDPTDDALMRKHK